MVKKAELHAHLEGTLTPALLKKLARRHNMAVPDGLLSADGQYYQWDEQQIPGEAPTHLREKKQIPSEAPTHLRNNKTDAGARLMAFVTAYDLATAVIKTPEDYFDLTLDYLARCAKEGSIYEELTIFADPEPTVGISYPAMLGALSDAIDRARDLYHIECRLLASFVRHYGIERSIKDAQTVIKHPHKYVTGITMAGAETMHEVKDFVPAYHMVRDALGLQMTAHAGEATGPETIRACHELLGITRFGHMVRIVEDPDFMAYMADIGAIAEICPSSNIALGVYADFEHHPLRRIHESGIKVTLNSDDPPFFKTSLGREYDIAHRHFGFSAAELSGFTRNAIEAAFIDEPTRQNLLSLLT